MPNSARQTMNPLIVRHWRLFGVAVSCHLGYALVPMQTPIAAGMIVAALNQENATFYGLDPFTSWQIPPITFSLWLLAALAAMIAIAAYFRSLATATLSRRIVAELRLSSMDAMLKMDDLTYDRFGPIELQDRIVNECAQVRRYVERVFVHAIVNTIRIAYPIIMLFTINVQLASLALALLAPQTIISLAILRKLHQATRTARERRAQLNNAIANLVRGREESQRTESTRLVHQLENDEIAARRLSALNMSNIWLFTSLGVALIWWCGALAVADGRIGLGELVAFVGLLAFVYQPVRQFTLIANTSRRGVVALERLGELHTAHARPRLARADSKTELRICDREAG